MSTATTGRGDALTARQKLFVEQYVVDRNGVQAFFRAYGRTTRGGRKRSYKAAQVQAARLLGKPIIAAEVNAATRALARRCRVSASRTLRAIAAIAFADIADIFTADPATGLPAPRPLRDVPPAARLAIQSVKIRKRVIRTRTLGEGPDRVQEIEEVEEVEYKLASKLGALDQLCRHLGLTKDGAGLEKLIELLSRPAEAAA